MGDMADLVIEQGMAEDDYRADHPEEFEDENCDMPPNPRRFVPKLKVCRNCGKGGFHWQKAPTGWRLFDKNNQIHNCNKKFAKGGKRIVLSD